jgi:GTP-binding protein EngB required for normal cell division
MDLRTYEQYKFELAELIRSGMLLAGGDRDNERRWRELLTKVAEDRFTVVVAGRFSRGKSSLMNAVFGADRLPTGIVPLTSVITYVRYGTDERVLLDYIDSGLRRETRLDELADYVTEKGNPGNVRRIRSAEIQVPAEILRRGFFFVDTPGLGSAIFENTQTTESFIPEIDLLVMVTSCESPLSEDEVRFLQHATPFVRHIFLVINKQDTIPAAARQEVIDYVTTAAHNVLGDNLPEPYCLSAKDALAAKQTHDADALRESGIERFEAELVRFLTEEKREAFLVYTCNRLRAEIESLPASSGNGLAAALDSFQRRIESDQSGAQQVQSSPASSADNIRSPKVKGCEICKSVWQAQFKFLSRYQYDLSTDLALQQEHAEQGGFCPLHTWHYEQITSPRGVCTAYPELINQIATRLRRWANDGYDQSSDGACELAPVVCPVCRIRQETEARIVTSILDRAAGRSSQERPSLCLPHLRLVLQYTTEASIRHTLLEGQAALLERLAEDLRRYAIKHDALRRGLASREEQDAPLHALELLVGHRNVNAVFSVRDIL